MISTLENARIKRGDRLSVKIGPSVCPAKVIDSSDPAKLKLELPNGSALWVGRRSVQSVMEYILVERSEWEDFCAVSKDRGVDFTYSEEDDGIHIHDHIDEADDILWAIQVLNERQRAI